MAALLEADVEAFKVEEDEAGIWREVRADMVVQYTRSRCGLTYSAGRRGAMAARVTKWSLSDTIPGLCRSLCYVFFREHPRKGSRYSLHSLKASSLTMKTYVFLEYIISLVH